MNWPFRDSMFAKSTAIGETKRQKKKDVIEFDQGRIPITSKSSSRKAPNSKDMGHAESNLQGALTKCHVPHLSDPCDH